MANALEIPQLASRSRQGVGARLLRRLGGAVRNAIAGSLALAGAVRRPAASQPGLGHTVARNAEARPALGGPAAARAQRAAAVAPSNPAPAGRRRPTQARTTFFPEDPNVPITPETVPGLGPEICAVLNTPLGECDPEVLRILLASLAIAIGHSMPAESGFVDPQGLFSSLWDRFAGLLDQPPPDAPAPAAPTAPAPAPMTQAPSPALTPAQPDPSPAPRPEPQTAKQPHDSVIHTADIRPAAPDTDALPSPLFHGQSPAPHHHCPFRFQTEWRRRSRTLRVPRSPLRGNPRQPMPLRRWCYAARASPA